MNCPYFTILRKPVHNESSFLERQQGAYSKQPPQSMLREGKQGFTGYLRPITKSLTGS